MPGLTLPLGALNRSAPRNHRWQAPPQAWMETPAFFQREAFSGAPRPAFPIGRAGAAPIDPIAVALKADARHASREGWLGVLLGIGVIALLLQGWLLPLLGAAFVAAPLAGIGLAMLDGRKPDEDRGRLSRP